MTQDSAGLLRDLRKHAANVAPRRLAVAATAGARTRHQAALQQFAQEFPDALVTDIGEAVSDVALVVVLCEGENPPQRAYFQTVATVGTEVPIVWGDPWRPYFQEAPRQADTGITLQGMLKLLSQYCPVVRPYRGAYCEFGTFDGRTFGLAYHCLKNVCGKFYAFDSFRGIKGTMADEGHFEDGRWAANVHTFEYNQRWANVDMNRVHIVPGFFQDTLAGRTITELGVESVTVANIDVDIYEPAALALDFVAPALQQGSVLMFDDYDHIAASRAVGERRALREFLEKHPEIEVEPYRNYGAAARAFLVHRN